MRDVVYMHHDDTGKDSFLSAYIKAQNNQRIPDEVFFVAGAILTVGLPELFFSFYGGFVLFLLLAGSLLVGAVVGVATYYYRSPFQTLSLKKATTILEVPPNRKDTTRKAA